MMPLLFRQFSGNGTGSRLENFHKIQLKMIRLGTVSTEVLNLYATSLGPQNHGKMKVLHPKLWVITPKNEGCGFPWFIPSLFSDVDPWPTTPDRQRGSTDAQSVISSV